MQFFVLFTFNVTNKDTVSPQIHSVLLDKGLILLKMTDYSYFHLGELLSPGDSERGIREDAEIPAEVFQPCPLLFYKPSDVILLHIFPMCSF